MYCVVTMYHSCPRNETLCDRLIWWYLKSLLQCSGLMNIASRVANGVDLDHTNL